MSFLEKLTKVLDKTILIIGLLFLTLILTGMILSHKREPQGFRVIRSEEDSRKYNANIRMDDMVISFKESQYDVNDIIISSRDEQVKIGKISEKQETDITEVFRIGNDSEPDRKALAEVDIVGKVYYVIPKIGYVLRYVSYREGMLITISLISIYLLLIFKEVLSRLIFRRKKKLFPDKKKRKTRKPVFHPKIKPSVGPKPKISFITRTIGELKLKTKSVDSLVKTRGKNRGKK